MSEPGSNDWRDLFEPAGAGGSTIVLDVARRQGEPWLLLPAPAALAVRALALYPAQSTKARGARLALRLALRLGLKPRLKRTQLACSPNDPFVEFLRRAADLPPLPPLHLAVLAGNPRAAGRRFVVLVFGRDGRAAAVVKAGVSASAQALIRREQEFLRCAPEAAPALPRLRESFQSPKVRALALDYFDGDTPRPGEAAELQRIMHGWLDRDRWVSVRELSIWPRLLEADGAGTFPPQVHALGEAKLRPSLFHGDFAPWNIKSLRGRWTVLDWERGELLGPPGWDWFHFTLQSALLVRGEPPAALLARLEALLRTPEFMAYARAAGVVDQMRWLGIAYLAYCLRVTRQTEGAENLRRLFELAITRWRSSGA